ncbi:hypothetical protein AB3N59_17615 [Leptospira sp. WS92.C1]
MQFPKILKYPKLSSLGLFLPQFVILGIYFQKLYSKFISFCPNREFLTWDPDVRLANSIQFATAFRSFDLITVLRLIFDSPTWPVLRNIPEAFFILLFGPGGTPVLLFTFGELIFLFLITPWILYRFLGSRDWVVVAFLFPIVWGGLLQNPGWMHYSFSGMLEIQGGFFFLPAILSFWELEKFSFEKNKTYSPWFLFLSVNFLFHTKYPYGYIFVFFGGLFLFLFRFSETKRLLFVIYDYYRENQLRIVPILLSVMLLLFSVILSKEVLPGKTKGFLRYVSALIFWISLSVSLWKLFYRNQKTEENRHFRIEEVSFVWKYFWTWVVFPIGSWVLMHPDRFSSSSSTIQHTQGAGLLPGQGDGSIFSLTYFEEILGNSLYAPYGGWILSGSMILCFWFGVLRFLREKKIQPSFFLLLSVLISILGLTLMTPNHQPRHIYHLYPILFITLGVFCYEMFHIPRLRIFFIGLYLILFLWTFGYWSWKNESVWEKTNLCFSGVDQSLFYTAVDAETVFLRYVNGSSVFWNRLPLEHHNRPDLALSFYRAGFINRQEVREKRKREELNFRQSKSDFWIAATTCEEIERNIGISTKELKFIKQIERFPIRGACIVKFGRTGF